MYMNQSNRKVEFMKKLLLINYYKIKNDYSYEEIAFILDSYPEIIKTYDFLLLSPQQIARIEGDVW